MKKQSSRSRRQFLKHSGIFFQGALFGSALSPSQLLAKMAPPVNKFNQFTNKNHFYLTKMGALKPESLSSISAITTQELFSDDFNGDEIARPHDLLWNIESYLQKKGGRPAVSEKFDVVIVGAGVAGLAAAYELRDQNVMVLDQAQQLGGNAKGERFENSLYSIGSAYINRPTEGSELDRLLKDLDLLNQFREEKSEDTRVFYKGTLASPFWRGATDPKLKEDFMSVQRKLNKIYRESYPEIPAQPNQIQMIFQNGANSANSYDLYKLDSLSFTEWCQENFPQIHPHILEYFQLYAWSSFAGSIDELSAAQMLNFLAAETEGIVAFPGGNSAITAALISKLRQTQGENHLRPGCIALDVRVESNNQVTVTYEDLAGQLHRVECTQAVMALPKFVAQRVIPQLPVEQISAMDRIPYRGYIVGNVILDRRIPSPCFDLYSLEGQMPKAPTAAHPPLRPFTDICFGSWAQNDQNTNSILTVYQALPYDGARQFLFSPASHEKFVNRIKQSLPPLLQNLGLSMNNIKGIRMTRWGHAIPVARKGLFSSGILERARADFQNKIYFANQDNWANPSVECAITSAFEVVKKLRK